MSDQRGYFVTLKQYPSHGSLRIHLPAALSREWGVAADARLGLLTGSGNHCFAFDQRVNGPYHLRKNSGYDVYITVKPLLVDKLRLAVGKRYPCRIEGSRLLVETTPLADARGNAA